MSSTDQNGSGDDLRDEYDFSKGVRGKYARRFAKGSNVVVLEPDVATVFGDAESVNKALRSLAESERAKQPSVPTWLRHRAPLELR